MTTNSPSLVMNYKVVLFVISKGLVLKNNALTFSVLPFKRRERERLKCGSLSITEPTEMLYKYLIFRVVKSLSIRIAVRYCDAKSVQVSECFDHVRRNICK